MIDELLSPVWGHLTDVQPVRGEGAYLIDAEGRRYLDFTSGIGVTSTGHSHPAVVDAIREQAGKLLFGQVNIVVTPAAIELAHALRALMPESLDTFFFSNSGAEAVEASLKLARHATGRPNVIVFQGSFHGRTAQTMALNTSKTVYRHRYAPLPSGVYVAPFPHALDHGSDEEGAVRYALRELDRVLGTQTAPDETAALLIEPVLGEGGYVPAPASFLRGLRELADAHGILLVFDEVQTGFGRTGKMFAFEHADVVPDVLVMAKGLGSGLPISAVAAPRALMERWETGTHGGTYGGGSTVPLAAAAATLGVLQDEDLVANAARMGERLIAGLRGLQARYPEVAEVRGLGLMIGVEFGRRANDPTADASAGRQVSPSAPDGGPAAEHPSKRLAKAVQKACLDERLLLLTCGRYEHVIRWIPPLIVNGPQVDDALAVFERALERVLGRAPARAADPAVA